MTANRMTRTETVRNFIASENSGLGACVLLQQSSATNDNTLVTALLLWQAGC